MKYVFIGLIFFCTGNICVSQEDPVTTWEDKMGDPKVNFYEIQQDYNDYWESKTPPKGSGHKPFKRWEYLMETRVNKEGYLDPLHRHLEYRKYWSGQRDDSNNKSMSNSWVSLGPFNEPSGHNGIGRINVIAEHPTNSSILFVGTPAGGLWKSTNGGTSWSTTTDTLASLGVSDIAFDPVNPNIMYIATGDRDHNDTSTFGILKSTDGGTSWTLTNFRPSFNGLPAFYLIHRLLIDPNDGDMIVSTTDGVFRSTDDGVSWTNVLSNTCIRHMEFKPGNSNIIYGTTSGSYCSGLHSVATYYRSTNNGQSWTQITLPNTTDIERLAIGVSDNNSSVMYLLASYNDPNDSNDFFALYKSTDSGATITEVAVTTDPSLGSQQWYDWSFAASPFDVNKLIAGGVGFRRSTNGGVSWTTGGSGVHVDHHFARYFGNNLYLGTDGGIYKSTNDGVSWTDLSSGLAIMQFYRISNAETDNARMLAGAQDNGTHQKIGSSWQDEYGGDGMDNAIDPNDASNLFISWQYGNFLRSTNGGSSFSTMIDDGTTGVTGAWVTPIKIDPNNTSTIYVGYDRVWKSTNDGVSWTDPAGSSLPGVNQLQYIDVAKSNSNYIYVTDYSRIWRSTNAGNSWTEVTDPGSSIRWIEIDPTDETHLWACVNHSILESSNSGASWSNITGSLPNVDMNTIVYDEGSNEAIYVGTDIGVFYKDASFPDWQPYNSALPNVIILELDILESDNKLRAATFGRGVWEVDLNVVPCSIDNIVDMGLVECDEVAGSYTRQVQVNYTGHPSSGTLQVFGQTFPITGSPQSVHLTNLPLDGASNNVQAFFSSDANCTLTVNNLFSNPTTCPCILQDANLSILPCDNKGTPIISDDTYSFSLNPQGQNLSGSYSVSGDINVNSISYGGSSTFNNGGAGYLISNGSMSISITDDGDSACTISNLFIESPSPCSGNYICSDAIELSISGSYAAIGPSQGNGGTQMDGSGINYHANWYYFTAPSDGFVQIGSCGGGIDTRLLIHNGNVCSNLSLDLINDDYCEMSSGSNLYASFTEICVEAGNTYFFEWDNRWSSSGFNFDFTFISGTPVSPTVSSFPYSESFDNDPNSWVLACDDDINWTRHSGPTPSANTGPSNAFDGSHYMYLEASGNALNFTYHLSPIFNFANLTNPQLSFYYHMYGSDMGTLQLQISNNGGQTWIPLFTKIGNQGDQWFPQIIDLNSYSGQTVQLRFYGVSGVDFKSDMAFDFFEITGTSGPCAGSMDVNGNPISDGTYEANIINSEGLVPANGNVLFRAQNEINLTDGFTVEQGGLFESTIGPCSTAQEENAVDKK